MLGAGVSGGLSDGVAGAADAHFARAMRAFVAFFPHPRLGGGALAVYLDGVPVVDVWIWTGWSDRQGKRTWGEDTAPMVFSATKGVASTVIHWLARHRAGLSHLRGIPTRWWPRAKRGSSESVPSFGHVPQPPDGRALRRSPGSARATGTRRPSAATG